MSVGDRWAELGVVMRLLSALILLAFSPFLPSAERAKINLLAVPLSENFFYEPSVWSLTDGILRGGSEREKVKRNWFITTKESFENFELEMWIRCHGDPKLGMINGGIQVRSALIKDDHVAGYQVDCGQNWFGALYDEHRRKLLTRGLDPEGIESHLNVFGWNHYRIVADGLRIRTWINDRLVTDYIEPHPEVVPADGRIAIQVHSGGNALVQVRGLSLRELPSTKGSTKWGDFNSVEEAIAAAKALVKEK